MSERNAKLLRKYEKFSLDVPRATTRKGMVESLLKSGHLTKIARRQFRRWQEAR